MSSSMLGGCGFAAVGSGVFAVRYQVFFTFDTPSDS